MSVSPLKTCFENRNIQESKPIPDDDETLVKPVVSVKNFYA